MEARLAGFFREARGGTSCHSQENLLTFKNLAGAKQGNCGGTLMSTKKIEKLLKQALLQNGEMHHSLYEFELEEIVDDLKQSMRDDNDDYIFSVTENNGHVAMVLIEKSGQVHVNEQAREKLKNLWPAAYKSNMQKLIPAFARQLNEDDIPVNGVKQI